MCKLFLLLGSSLCKTLQTIVFIPSKMGHGSQDVKIIKIFWNFFLCAELRKYLMIKVSSDVTAIVLEYCLKQSFQCLNSVLHDIILCFSQTFFRGTGKATAWLIIPFSCFFLHNIKKDQICKKTVWCYRGHGN